MKSAEELRAMLLSDEELAEYNLRVFTWAFHDDDGVHTAEEFLLGLDRTRLLVRAAQDGRDAWCVRRIIREVLHEVQWNWDSQAAYPANDRSKATESVVSDPNMRVLFHECLYRVGWLEESFDKVMIEIGVSRTQLQAINRETPRREVDEDVVATRTYFDHCLQQANEQRVSLDKVFGIGPGRPPKDIEHFQIACREHVRKEHLKWVRAALENPPYGPITDQERRELEKKAWDLDNDRVAHIENIAAILRAQRPRVERWWCWLEDLERRPDENGLYLAICDSSTLNPFDEQLREKHPLVRPDLRYM